MTKNNKAFVLVETLIVSVAITAIFSVIYFTTIPILGEYQKTVNYDDVDTTYIAHWMRILIIKKGNTALYNKMENLKVKKSTDSYVNLTSGNCATYFIDKNVCENFFAKFNVNNVYITKYTLENASKEGFKPYVKATNTFSAELQNYTQSLATYKNTFVNGIEKQNFYRLVVEVEHNTGAKETNDYFKTFANVEVNSNVTVNKR